MQLPEPEAFTPPSCIFSRNFFSRTLFFSFHEKNIFLDNLISGQKFSLESDKNAEEKEKSSTKEIFFWNLIS